MPINNGNYSFSTGRDCTVVLMGPFGQVDMPNIMKFEAKQVTAAIAIDRLDGVQLFADLPKGWSGSIEVERGSAGVDQLFAVAEQAWVSGGVYNVSTLFQYVTEKDGSTSTFQYTNVALSLSDAGSWAGDASVKQRIEFKAYRRQSV